MMAMADLSYCGDMVREQDPDRFLLSMFAPADRREALWALFAFNHEIAKTREVVSETQLGLIRLQWWRERLEEIYSGKPIAEHHVLQALAQAIQSHNLPYEHFEMLLHAREFDLEDVLPGNVEGFLNYLDFTSTPLMKLAVKVSGGDVEIEPVQAVAVNYALVGILRAVPFHGRQRRCYLPEDLMKKAGQRLDHLYEGKLVDGFSGVIKTICDQYVDGVRCENRFLRKVGKLADIYIQQARKADYDVFSPKMSVPPAFKAFRLIL